MVLALVALLGVLIVFAARRVSAIAYEGAVLSSEVIALIEGRPSAAWEERKRKMQELKRKGAGLRLKFTMLVVVLVIIVVLIVAVPLGFQMTNNQRAALASGLSKQSEILIGSLTSAAMSSIKEGGQGYASVATVPASRLAMSEAMYATITGPSEDPAANANPGPEGLRVGERREEMERPQGLRGIRSGDAAGGRPALDGGRHPRAPEGDRCKAHGRPGSPRVQIP